MRNRRHHFPRRFRLRPLPPDPAEGLRAIREETWEAFMQGCEIAEWGSDCASQLKAANLLETAARLARRCGEKTLRAEALRERKLCLLLAGRDTGFPRHPLWSTPADERVRCG
jgi:hypothetical protein